MEIIGIVAEYNPFHNGHLYQINQIKKKYPDSLIIVVLNGYFMQRGELSILSKEDKVKIALQNNIDIIIELPFLFGTQSADTFANASVKLLKELKITKLIFGSEEDNIKLLEQIAKKQLNNDLKIKSYLDQGDNYPTALKKAIDIDFDYNSPNDLLGISYIKTIMQNNYNIQYESIKRTSDYHDITSNDSLISATNIRNKLNNNIDISNFIPFNINDYKINLNSNNLFLLLKYQIITNSNLQDILSVDEGLENKLKKEINNVSSLEELITKIKSKRYTYNRIKRMLIHILMNVKKENVNIKIDYLRILGFNNNGQKYLNQIKNDIILPLYNKHTKSIIKDYEIKASKIYDQIFNTNTYSFEEKNKPVKK